VTPAATDTKQRLRDAALLTVRERGIAGVSARTVAANAGVNQAVIYYHFGSLHALLEDASLHATAARVATYRARFAEVDSLDGLVEVARELHAEEAELGNVTVLAQMLAGAQTDEQLAPSTSAALQLWIDEVEATLDRLLDGTVLADLVDVPALARGVSAAFVGIELVDGVAGEDDLPTLGALTQLAALVQVVLDLGPVASTALRRRVHRTVRDRRP
jgi:AcrR family transcriptional regulator